jgi:tetratricopeptide (TPR) repeat protein
MAAHRRGDLAGARRAYEAALRVDAHHPLATHYLGVLAYQDGDLDRALPLLERSAHAVPDEPEFQNNLGLALAAADRLDDAVAAYRRAVSLKPDHAGAWSNLGLACTAQNALAPAEEALRRAIALQPGFAAAHWNLALVLLAQRRYDEGWREYEWRLRAPEFGFDAAISSLPRWSGESLQGRRLMLVAEQGLGDTLQFVRHADALAKRGAHVVARVPQALAALVARVPGVAEVNVRETPPAQCDFQLPLLSLPGALAIGSDTQDAPPFPYLRVDAARRDRVASEVRARARGRRAVGLAWAGARRNTNDRRRSMPLATLAPLLERDDIAWFSLQHEDSGDVANVAAARALHRLDDRVGFDGLAALIDALDLVVTVDTSVAHVAGALGKPVWVMVPFAPDWRWGLDQDTTGWYPAMRLVRQARLGDWRGVIERIDHALREVTNP